MSNIRWPCSLISRPDEFVKSFPFDTHDLLPSRERGIHNTGTDETVWHQVSRKGHSVIQIGKQV